MADPFLSETLHSLEDRLLQPVVRADRAALESLLAPEFREFGSSGRVFDREAIISLLSAEASSPRHLSLRDFACLPLGPDAALVTYRSASHGLVAEALRSSIWAHRDGRWQMLFHQGTRSATHTPDGSG